LPSNSYVSSTMTSVLKEDFGQPPVTQETFDDPAARDSALEYFLTHPHDYGNSSLCYYDVSDGGYESTENFGPMRPGLTAEERAQEQDEFEFDFELDPYTCGPQSECHPPNVTGINIAFVHQTAKQLGFPFSRLTKKFIPGGFAITTPGNMTYAQYFGIIRRLLLGGHWIDRQTRYIMIQFSLYNLETNLVANLELTVETHPTGDIKSDIVCAAIPIVNIRDNLLYTVPEIVLTLWLLIRFTELASRLFIKKKPVPGEKPVRCVITAELVVHLITTVLGLLGSAYRFWFLSQQQAYYRLFQPGKPWPTPFMPNISFMINLFEDSRSLYAWALLTCTLRFSLYYSLVNKKLYILRLTISRASFRLVPTLLLLVSTLFAFAIFANQLYFSSTSMWSDGMYSIAGTLYLLRRPTGMAFEQMANSHSMWPLDAEQPNPLTIIFLLGFLVSVSYVMTNLYRASIINEYSTVVDQYRTKPPGDLTDQPWPSFDPRVLYQAYRENTVQQRHESLIRRRQKVEWAALLSAQKKKQRQFVIDLRERQKKNSATDSTTRSQADDKSKKKRRFRSRRRLTASAV